MFDFPFPSHWMSFACLSLEGEVGGESSPSPEPPFPPSLAVSLEKGAHTLQGVQFSIYSHEQFTF